MADVWQDMFGVSPFEVPEIYVTRCREKTERGNVYLTLADAEHAALEMSKKRRVDLHGFFCPHCKKYHIGKVKR